MIRRGDGHVYVHQPLPVEALQDVAVHLMHLQPRRPHRSLAGAQLGRRQLLSVSLSCTAGQNTVSLANAA